MTAVTFPDGTKFSDDGSSPNDMQFDGHRTHFLPMVGKTIGVSADAVAAADAAQQSAAAASDDAAATAADRSAVAGDRAISEAARDAASAYAVQAQQWIGSASNVVIAALSKQIAATTTLVDCFVYDTRLDSDGGAWIDKCGATSWENESLNTATRGARRKAPITPSLVGEASKITCYDALDLDGNGAPRLWKSWVVAGLTCLFVQAGKIWYGGTGGLYLIDLPNDRVYRYSTAGLAVANQTAAAYSQSTAAWTVVNASASIVSNTVNSVTSRVLPGAPLDAAGLAVPTVAVATAGGVSVIRHDGNVWDITRTGGFASVRFVSDTRLWASVTVGNGNGVQAGPIPDADTTDSAWRQKWYLYNSAPALIYNEAAKIAPGAISSGSGLTLLAEDTSNPANGMVAYLTATYCTGWMPGNTVGAWLNGSETGAITGSGELVANGTFATDTSGWTSSGSTASVVSGELTLTATGATNEHLYQDIAVSVGNSYVLTFDAYRVDGVNGRVDVTPTNYSKAFATFSVSSTGKTTYTVTIAPDVSTVRLGVRFDATNATVGARVRFDNISVRLATPDRSYKAKGLIVNGTLQRNAANGGDVVAWSGFSASNYLEQPYNSDLDFGAGDFFVAGWLKFTGTNQVILGRGDGTNYDFRLGVNGSGNLFAGLSQVASTAKEVVADSASNTGNSAFFVLAKRGTEVELWVDGAVKKVTGVTASILVSTLPAFTVGVKNHTTALTPFSGSIALFRTGAYAPSADQIAKMYRDERPLFDSGARCLLGGTSSSVQSLSYDDSTGKLAVGTGDGVSVFSGLRRVDYKDAAGVAFGAELVSNPGGPFVNTTGWTGSNAALSVVGGEMQVNVTTTGGSARFALSGLTVGRSYLLVGKVRQGANTGSVRASITGISDAPGTAGSSVTELLLAFTATATTHTASAYAGGTGTFFITSFSVRELGAISTDNIKAISLRGDTLLIGTSAEAGIVAPQVNGREAIVAPRGQAVAVQPVASSSGGNFDFAMLLAIGGGINIPYLGK